MDFGTKLKILRKHAGLTQQQLAGMLGVTKSVVSFYELQERSPSPDVLVKLAGIFHVSTDYLLGLDTAQTIDVSGLDERDISALRTLADSLRLQHSTEIHHAAPLSKVPAVHSAPFVPQSAIKSR